MAFGMERLNQRYERVAARDEGFSLLELIVVMGLLALALGVVLPSLVAGRDQVRVEQVAARIALDMKKARAAAILGGVPIAVSLDTKAHGYRMDGAASTTLLPRSASITWQVPPHVRPGSHAARIVFYPDGSASGATLTLADQRGRVSTLTIDRVTGQAAVSGGG